MLTPLRIGWRAPGDCNRSKEKGPLTIDGGSDEEGDGGDEKETPPHGRKCTSFGARYPVRDPPISPTLGESTMFVFGYLPVFSPDDARRKQRAAVLVDLSRRLFSSLPVVFP